MRSSFAFLFLVALALPAVQASDHAVPALYLQGPTEWQDHRNFTAAPPGEDATTMQIQPIQEHFRAFVDWRTFSLPGDWVLSPDAEPTAHFWLRGLDQLVPVPDVRPAEAEDPGSAAAVANPAALGHVIVEVAVLRRGDPADPIASGEALHQPNPLAPNQVYAFSVRMDVNDEVVLREGNDTFSLAIKIIGRNVTNVSPIRILVGSTDHPSRLEAPGLPIADWAAAEHQEGVEREQLTDVLQGPDVDQAGAADTIERAGTGTVEEAPFFSLAPLALGTLVLAFCARRRP